MEHSFRAAVFDLDGTLLDTLQDLGACADEALRQYGFPGHTMEEYRSYIGNGIPRLIARAVPEGTSEQDIQKVEEAVCRRADAFQLVLETDGNQRNGHAKQKPKHRAFESAERRAQNGKQNCRHYRVEGVLCRPLAELIVGEAHRHNADAHTEQKPDEATCKPSEHRAQHRPDDAGQNKYGNILCLPRIFQLVHPRNADNADCNAEQ